MDIKKLKNIILNFTIPYAIDVSNSTKKEDEGSPYIVVINYIPAQIRFERKYNEDCIKKVKLAQFSKIENDRYGLLSKTEVQVWFDNQTFDNFEFGKDELIMKDRFFFNLSIKYLNKFLRNYKQVTREFWIRPVNSKDILNYDYILLDTEKTQQATHVLLNNTVCFNGGKEIIIDNSKDNLLRNNLFKENVSLIDDLYLSILDNYDLENFNICLIQCAILFENFVYSTLNKKLSKTKLKKIMKNPDCECFVGIYQVCSTGLKKEFGVNYGQCEEFKLFHTKVLKIRNDLVHGSKLDSIKEEEARSAIDSTLKAIEKYKKDMGISN
ncbi:hypothetical protein JWJ90_13360 [Desulfobulbus rhabdoformis]|uniref:hypothetical protein n=1 Tax=Desulfobulbus rhabdoformis TaxID=34032 RepID=UPI001962DB77|nr:hypothetical protein [Desulfobulbus rhabdoformis]MBM9615266.1 hypothetical protein [Desulfobulbus rhabdoformis]